jgi:plasmid maintenance system antidote protein VapI
VKQVLAGASMAAALLAGIYAISTTTATRIAESFDTTHSESRLQRIAFESALTRESAERAAASEKCDQGARRERSLCKAAVRADDERTVLRSLAPSAPSR